MADQIVEAGGSHEPTEFAKTPKKAAMSGWIGSALEYYDFFIYAQAAALVFPTLFFPADNPQVGIVASFATFGVGYAARPLGAFILGHWGDKHGRKTVLILCMMLIGFSTFCVGLLPSYATIRPRRRTDQRALSSRTRPSSEMPPPSTNSTVVSGSKLERNITLCRSGGTPSEKMNPTARKRLR